METWQRRSPWAYVWPIAVGVMLGVLLADGVRLVATVVGLSALLDGQDDAQYEGTTPGHLPARPDQ